MTRDVDLDEMSAMVGPALLWVKYGTAYDPRGTYAKTLIQQVPALVEALTAARVDARRYRAERNWLLAGLDDAGRGNFHMLAQTQDEAIAELGEDRYRELINAVVAAERAEVARNDSTVAAIAATNADTFPAAPEVSA